MSDSNVCQNQDKFNQAFHEALNNDKEKYMDKNKNWLTIYSILWLISMIWAVILAMKVKDPEHRVIHLVLAFLFSPIYVLSHYMSAIDTEGSEGSEGSEDN